MMYAKNNKDLQGFGGLSLRFRFRASSLGGSGFGVEGCGLGLVGLGHKLKVFV